EESDSEGCTLGARQFGASQPEAAEGFQQNITERGEEQAELIRPPVMAAGAVGEQAQLLFLDPILHVSSSAIHVLVERLGISLQIRDQKPGILALRAVLGFDN